jgi:hypothetical protein
MCWYFFGKSINTNECNSYNVDMINTLKKRNPKQLDIIFGESLSKSIFNSVVRGLVIHIVLPSSLDLTIRFTFYSVRGRLCMCNKRAY